MDRPFDRALLDQARRIASCYRIIIQPEGSLGFIGRSVELPGVMADGPTQEACVRAVLFATETAVAAMLEMGQEPPTAAAARQRTEQINIRLTKEEKLLLEEESQRSGFRGVSDYVRAAVLRRA